ncbi:hypothetical protein D3C76_1272140 [compost metagenome]
MPGSCGLQAQRIHPAGLQWLPERHDQHAAINRFRGQGQVGHRHPQASRRRIQRQFVEVERYVPVIRQRFAAPRRQPLAPGLLVGGAMQQCKAHQVCL